MVTDMDRFIEAADALAEAAKAVAEEAWGHDHCYETAFHARVHSDLADPLTEYRAAREATTKSTPPAFATSA